MHYYMYYYIDKMYYYIDKIYLYAKDPYEAKHQYLINKLEKVGLLRYNDHKAFIEYSNDMQDAYENIEKKTKKI